MNINPCDVGELLVTDFEESIRVLPQGYGVDIVSELEDLNNFGFRSLS